MALYRLPQMTSWHQINPSTGTARCSSRLKLDTDEALCIEAVEIASQPDVRDVCGNCFSVHTRSEKFGAVLAAHKKTIPRTKCPKCSGGKLNFSQESRTYRCTSCLRRFTRNADDELVVRSGKSAATA